MRNVTIESSREEVKNWIDEKTKPYKIRKILSEELERKDADRVWDRIVKET